MEGDNRAHAGTAGWLYGCPPVRARPPPPPHRVSFFLHYPCFPSRRWWWLWAGAAPLSSGGGLASDGSISFPPPLLSFVASVLRFPYSEQNLDKQNTWSFELT